MINGILPPWCINIWPQRWSEGTLKYFPILGNPQRQYHPDQRMICAIVDSFYLWPISSWPPQWMKTPQLAIWGKTWEHDDKPTSVLFSLPQSPLCLERERVPSLFSCSSTGCLQLHQNQSQVSPSTGNLLKNTEEKEIEVIFCWKSGKLREAQNILYSQLKEISFCCSGRLQLQLQLVLMISQLRLFNAFFGDYFLASPTCSAKQWWRRALAPCWMDGSPLAASSVPLEPSTLQHSQPLYGGCDKSAIVGEYV